MCVLPPAGQVMSKFLLVVVINGNCGKETRKCVWPSSSLTSSLKEKVGNLEKGEASKDRDLQECLSESGQCKVRKIKPHKMCHFKRE